MQLRVETWDNGTYEIIEIDKDKLVLRFNGKRPKDFTD